MLRREGVNILNNTENELRGLMNLYLKRLAKLDEEKQECLDDEEEMTLEVLQIQCRVMIAELFQTMKRLNVLDEEEIEFGAIKKK